MISDDFCESKQPLVYLVACRRKTRGKKAKDVYYYSHVGFKHQCLTIKMSLYPDVFTYKGSITHLVYKHHMHTGQHHCSWHE